MQVSFMFIFLKSIILLDFLLRSELMSFSQVQFHEYFVVIVIVIYLNHYCYYQYYYQAVIQEHEQNQ